MLTVDAADLSLHRLTHHKLNVTILRKSVTAGRVQTYVILV